MTFDPANFRLLTAFLAHAIKGYTIIMTLAGGESGDEANLELHAPIPTYMYMYMYTLGTACLLHVCTCMISTNGGNTCTVGVMERLRKSGEGGREGNRNG